MHIYSVYIETQAPLTLVGIENVGKKNEPIENTCTCLLL